MMSGKREKKRAFSFWRNAQEIPSAIRTEIGNIKSTETPQFANWSLKKLSYVQKLAFNRTKKVPQSISMCGV